MLRTSIFVFLLSAYLVASSCAFQMTRPAVRAPRLGSFFDPLDSALDFWSPFSRAINKHWTSGLRPAQASTPEITETDTAYYITLDTAGYTKEELDIHVLGHEISIEGNHKCDKPGLCIARQFSKRYAILAANINLDGISSRRTSDGVLQLAIPKHNRRNIHVAVAEEPSLDQITSQTAALQEPAQDGPAEKVEEVTVEVVKD